MKPVRLQKYLASTGIGSRRHCEQLIREGKVVVNGIGARIGMSVVPGKERVTVQGREVKPQTGRIVVMLNKPAGYLSTCRPGREKGLLVTRLVDLGCRLYPAGRLDRDSEGLLILTNDGDLALRLTHPRYGKEKEYEVELDRPCDRSVVQELKKGVQLGDGPAEAVRVRRTGSGRLQVVLTQGRKRQLRRMLQVLGYEVTRLKRVRVAGLMLDKLKPGEWRQLTDKEVKEKLLGNC